MSKDTNASLTSEAKIRDLTGVARTVKRIAGATLGVAAFALFAGTIADSFRPINAEEVQINATLGTGSLQITDGACSVSGSQTAYDATNNQLNISVLSGSIASNCLGITATTSNPQGYTLTIDGPDDGNLTLAGQAITSKSGDMTAPSIFTASANGAEWGFAIPSGQIQGHTWGFDSSYAVLAANNTTNTANYAPVPTNAVAFSTTSAANTSADNYDIFFAVESGINVPTGTYTGTVVISGVGNALGQNQAGDCSNLVTGFNTGCTDAQIAMTLPTGLVPVKYTGTDATPEWTVMDQGDPDWYNYAMKEWANAVTFPSGYTLPAAGTVISAQSDIGNTTTYYTDVLGYWTYVPRYEYRLINTGFDGVSTCGPTNPQFCPQTFDIRFVSTDVAPKVAQNIGEWHSHPGFRTDLNGDGDFNDANEQVAGLWVAKYEASAQGNIADVVVDGSGVMTTQGTAAVDCTDNAATTCDNSSYVTTFLPGVPSWTKITLANIFANTQRVPADHGVTFQATSTAGSPDGATGMSNGWNNFSWGAVAYLSQSLYGVCSNKYCTVSGAQSTAQSSADHQKVWNNGFYNSDTIANTSRSRYLTGCGPYAANADTYGTTCNAWFGTIGKTASTTGNQSGIYDMAGGVWEYTFSAYGPDDNNITLGSSGLTWTGTGFEYRKFGGGLIYSLTQLSVNNYNAIHLGNLANKPQFFGSNTAETVSAASATGSWSGDYAYSVVSGNPWAPRGGSSADGSYAGSFAFLFATGGVFNAIGHRTILSGY